MVKLLKVFAVWILINFIASIVFPLFYNAVYGSIFIYFWFTLFVSYCIFFVGIGLVYFIYKWKE